MFALLMGLQTIAPAQLNALLPDASIEVLDVNARSSWLKARVPGARHLDPFEFGAADLPAAKDTPLVFYCSNPLCRKAPNAARRARRLGHTDVRVMSAGISGWLAAQLPVASGE